MKKLLLLTVFLIPSTLWGQTVINSGFFNQMTNYRGGIGLEELLAIPYGDTATTGAIFNGSYRKEGRIMINEADNKLYFNDGDKWVQVGASEIVDAFLQGGNEFGETAVLGTNDDESVEIISNGTPVIRIHSDGRIQFLDGTEGDGKVIMSSNDGTISAQDFSAIVDNYIWKWEKITFTGNILSSDKLKGELSMLVYLNDVPVDWEDEGAVHDPIAGTLNVTAMGGMDGTIIFQYRNLQD